MDATALECSPAPSGDIDPSSDPVLFTNRSSASASGGGSKYKLMSHFELPILSGTMSNPSDWLQFYSNQNNNNNDSLSGQGLALPQGGAQVSTGAAAMFGDQQLLSQPTTHQDATIVTTTANTSTASAANHSSINNNNNNSGLSPEGRVSKPVRKRSRASRRTPTTTLNTDTANFRAMVQQFTGGPSTASFGPSHPGTTNYGFGASLGSTRQAGFVNNPNDSVMMQAPAGYINHLQLQQQNPYLLSLNNNNSSSDINNSHGFVQRLMNSASARPTSLNMGGGSFSNDSDEFLSTRREQGSGGQVQMMARGAGVIGSTGRRNSNSNSANGNENRSNSFLF